MRGSPSRGLLKAMIQAANVNFGGQAFFTAELTDELLRQNYWGKQDPQSPERTVNMYCSQNPEVFEHVGSDLYRLKTPYRKQ